MAFIQCGGFVTEGYLTEKVQKLSESVDMLITPDLKALLKHISVDEKKDCVDTTIAAYLLNPLKNDYAYDDLAKDYLGIMIPSQADLLGKLKLPKAAEEKAETVGMLACYMAYTSVSVSSILLEKLRKSGMEKLYREIEMPLVFTLDDMEKEGVRTDGAALKVYGEQLVGKIAELEQSIYEKAGGGV